jgi:hypothetical protein
MAKKRFLFCYHKARIDALTEANICSGWRSAGLWPVSKHRALGSHFIAEIRQKAAKSRKSSSVNSFSSQLHTPKCFSRPSALKFATPRRSQELRWMVAIYARQTREKVILYALKDWTWWLIVLPKWQSNSLQPSLDFNITLSGQNADHRCTT